MVSTIVFFGKRKLLIRYKSQIVIVIYVKYTTENLRLFGIYSLCINNNLKMTASTNTVVLNLWEMTSTTEEPRGIVSHYWKNPLFRPKIAPIYGKDLSFFWSSPKINGRICDDLFLGLHPKLKGKIRE